MSVLRFGKLCFGDPDKAPIPVLTSLLLYDPFVPFSIVPLAAVQATCEMARELLIADRTA